MLLDPCSLGTSVRGMVLGFIWEQGPAILDSGRSTPAPSTRLVWNGSVPDWAKRLRQVVHEGAGLRARQLIEPELHSICECVFAGTGSWESKKRVWRSLVRPPVPPVVW